MAYTKRGPKYKRTRQYRARVSYRNPAIGKLSADVKYLKTVVNAEMNYFIFATTNNIDSVGRIDSLNNIPVGDDHNNRTGTSILPRFQSVNLHVNKSLTGPAHETIRVILFRYWGEETSQAPNVTIGDVLQSTSPLSYLNDDNAGKKGDRERRIEIHKSKLFTLDNVATTSRTWKWNVQVNGPNKNIKDHMKYRANVLEGPISGGFYLLQISDNATGANKAAFGVNCKLNYYDN